MSKNNIKNDNEAILNTAEIGTSKRKTHSTTNRYWYDSAITWTDKHILPWIAMAIMGALAMEGLTHNMPDYAQEFMTAGALIAVVALMVKIRAR